MADSIGRCVVTDRFTVKKTPKDRYLLEWYNRTRCGGSVSTWASSLTVNGANSAARDQYAIWSRRASRSSSKLLPKWSPNSILQPTFGCAFEFWLRHFCRSSLPLLIAAPRSWQDLRSCAFGFADDSPVVQHLTNLIAFGSPRSGSTASLPVARICRVISFFALVMTDAVESILLIFLLWCCWNCFRCAARLSYLACRRSSFTSRRQNR